MKLSCDCCLSFSSGFLLQTRRYGEAFPFTLFFLHGSSGCLGFAKMFCDWGEFTFLVVIGRWGRLVTVKFCYEWRLPFILEEENVVVFSFFWTCFVSLSGPWNLEILDSTSNVCH